MAAWQARLLRGPRRHQERLRRGHQEGLSQARDEAPPGPQPGYDAKTGGEVQGGQGSLRDPHRPAEARRLRPVRPRRRDPHLGGRGGAGASAASPRPSATSSATSSAAAAAAPPAASRSSAAATCATTSRSRSSRRRAATKPRSASPRGDLRDLQGHRRQARHPARARCTTCHGAGTVRMRQGFFSIQQTCPTCHGSGKIIPDPCADLPRPGPHQEAQDAGGEDPGRRRRRHAHPLERRRRARPERRPARRPLRRDPHQAARRLPARRRRPALRDADRHRRPPRSAATIEIPTLDGKAEIELPEGTQNGKTFRLRGKGIKGVRSSYPGDLYCHVSVETPVKLTEHQRKLLKELDEGFRKAGDRHSPTAKTWSDRVKDLFKA